MPLVSGWCYTIGCDHFLAFLTIHTVKAQTVSLPLVLMEIDEQILTLPVTGGTEISIQLLVGILHTIYIFLRCAR